MVPGSGKHDLSVFPGFLFQLGQKKGARTAPLSAKSALRDCGDLIDRSGRLSRNEKLKGTRPPMNKNFW